MPVQLPIADVMALRALLHPQGGELAALLAGGALRKHVKELYPIRYSELPTLIATGRFDLATLLLAWQRSKVQHTAARALVEKLTGGFNHDHEFMHHKDNCLAEARKLAVTGGPGATRYLKEQDLALLLLWACDHPERFSQISPREEELLAAVARDSLSAFEFARVDHFVAG